jgi:hypothetical protein
MLRCRDAVGSLRAPVTDFTGSSGTLHEVRILECGRRSSVLEEAVGLGDPREIAPAVDAVKGLIQLGEGTIVNSISVSLVGCR